MAKPKKSVQNLPPLDALRRYTVDDALAYLCTSRATIYNLIAAGELKVIKEGKRTFVPGSEIARRSSVAAARV